MSMKRLALLSCMTPAVLALGIAACGGDLTLPDANAGIALRVVDGDGQVGTVGEALPSEVVVELKTQAGAPRVGSQADRTGFSVIPSHQILNFQFSISNFRCD